MIRQPREPKTPLVVEKLCASLFPGGHGEDRECVLPRGHAGSHLYGRPESVPAVSTVPLVDQGAASSGETA